MTIWPRHFSFLISFWPVGAGIRLPHGAHKDVEEAGNDEETHDGQEHGADTAAVTGVIQHQSGPDVSAGALLLLDHHHVVSPGLSGVHWTRR